MRLHRLSITGFGPFAGSEQIDLDALASSGLFLIHGPTGAGKSSILDAICFALYAAVPGARTGARAGLRSDHAGEGVIPEVTLEFTASGRRVRVCRSPEFSRPKKRGTGDTTVPAKVVLEEMVGSTWMNRGTRHDEVAMVLKDILGMGLEQFIKVVLLPQGEFAAFLRASPEERRSVLAKLFDTQRFADIESWLVERRRQTAAAVGSSQTQLATCLLRVDDVIARLDAGDDLIVPAWSTVLPDVVDADVARLLAAVELRASSALAGVELSRAAAARAEAAVHRGTAVLGHQRTAGEARSRLNALDEQRGVYADALRAVAIAAQAGAVHGFVVAAQSSTRLRDAAAARVAELRSALTHIVGDGADAGPDLDVEASAMPALIGRMACHDDALQQLVTCESRSRTMAQESAQHRKAAQLADESLLQLARQRGDAEIRRLATEASRDAGRAAVADIPALEARHKSLSRIQKLLRDQALSTDSLETLQRQADSADRQFLDARGCLLDLRERRFAGMSAELAGGLEAGDPCPVCGSCEHPILATNTDVISPADIRSAETDQSRAAEALGLVRSQVAAEVALHEARASELTADLGLIPAADVHGALAVATAALAQCRTSAAALTEAQAQLVAVTTEIEELQVRIGQAGAAAASSLALAGSALVQSQAAEAEVTRLLADHRLSCPCQSSTQDDAGIPDDPGGDAAQSEIDQPDAAQREMDHSDAARSEIGEPDAAQGHIGDARVGQVVSEHRETLARLRLLGTALYELLTHDVNAREAALRLSTALGDNGFESLEQVQLAMLPPAKVVELTALLRAAEQQRAEATALLAQPDVVASLTRATPDADALARAQAAAATSLTDVGRLHTLSEQAQRDLRVLSGSVRQAVADLGPAQEEARVVQELADCVAGNSADNALRMRLSAYVLAARLAEIATLANERLRTMSDGRYALEYSDARAAKGARSGLGLLVRDAWTGRTRETSSLSGGEAFMASLALALGLGDAVRAEAGGFDLQTLFVDEGFGTLDEDSLEQVMAVLDTLREGGRAVGIVSHVTELRQRIPHQLEVVKEQAGSRIRTDNVGSPAA